MPRPDVPVLPPEMPSHRIRVNGVETQVVSLKDAASLADLSEGSLMKWIQRGRVEICYSPDRRVFVLVASLWDALPESFKVDHA